MDLFIGSAMYGYVIKADTGEWQLIGQRNPQDPQVYNSNVMRWSCD